MSIYAVIGLFAVGCVLLFAALPLWRDVLTFPRLNRRKAAKTRLDYLDP